MEDYKIKATNPQQYDSPDLDWRIDGGLNSPSRIFFRNHLKAHLEDLSGKNVLDIGSGVGHLFNMLFELGAKEIVGIEPSKRNVEESKKLHPNVGVHNATLEEYNPDGKQFDIVISIMVFEHILDIKKAFGLISDFLKHGSKLYLIVGDKEFHVQSRPDLEVDVQKISDDVTATKTIRPNGTMYDIFRSLDLYIQTANESGLKLVGNFELGPTVERPNNLDNKPSCHLLIFQKG